MKNKSYFETRYTYNSGRAKVWRAISEFLQKWIKEDVSILEIGCGYCDFINQIKSVRKSAIDYDEKSIEYKNSDVDFKQISILDYEFETKFDVIFASNFLEHFSTEEISEILKKCYGGLKKNGLFILIQPNYYYSYRSYWDDYTHKTALTHNSIQDILKIHGFDVVDIKKRFLPFSFKSKLPASYWLTKLYLLSPIKPFAKQMLIIAIKNV